MSFHYLDYNSQGLAYPEQKKEPAMFPSNEPEWEVLSRHLVYVGKWQITKNDDARNYRFLNRDTGLTRILTEEFVRSKGLKNTLCLLEGNMKDLERWVDDSVKSSTLIKELFPDNNYYWELSESDFDKYDWELLEEANRIKKKMNADKWLEIPRGNRLVSLGENLIVVWQDEPSLIIKIVITGAALIFSVFMLISSIL